MKNQINIAVVGLGQVGIYLLNELNTKKKELLNLLREKYGDHKTMSFDEFNIFLKDYSNKAEYPDINR